MRIREINHYFPTLAVGITIDINLIPYPFFKHRHSHTLPPFLTSHIFQSYGKFHIPAILSCIPEAMQIWLKTVYPFQNRIQTSPASSLSDLLVLNMLELLFSIYVYETF